MVDISRNTYSHHQSIIHCFLQLSADVLGCNVYGDGSVAAIDTWNPSSKKTNELDNDQVRQLIVVP